MCPYTAGSCPRSGSSTVLVFVSCCRTMSCLQGWIGFAADLMPFVTCCSVLLMVGLFSFILAMWLAHFHLAFQYQFRVRYKTEMEMGILRQELYVIVALHSVVSDEETMPRLYNEMKGQELVARGRCTVVSYCTWNSHLVWQTSVAFHFRVSLFCFVFVFAFLHNSSLVCAH